jgi:peptide/nickel transport system substrate-binding protein
LRKGVKFHDGTEFDAEDVKFTMDRIMDPKVGSPVKGFLTGLKETVAIDKHTVEMRFDKFFPMLLANLYIQVWNVSKEFYQGKSQDWLSTRCMGTGMYKFVEWAKGEKVVVEANDHYWGKEKAPSKYLIFRFIPEVATKVAALKTGEIDIAANIPPEEISALQKNPNTKITSCPTSRVVFVALRTDRDTPLKDKKVRQAFNYAINKEEISKTIAMGYVEPLQGQPVSKFHFGFNPNIKAYPYDPDKARKLLKEAGYPKSFKFKMGGPIGRFLKDQEMGSAVVSYLSEIGVDVDYQPEAWSVYYSKWQKKDPPFDMAFHAWGGASTFDPEGTIPLHIETGGSQSHYSNKEVDALAKQGREEPDIKKREKIYHKMMEILYDDPPWIYLTTHVDIHGYRSRLKFSARPDEMISARDIRKP